MTKLVVIKKLVSRRKKCLEEMEQDLQVEAEVAVEAGD
jgi:hypothetical protein